MKNRIAKKKVILKNRKIAYLTTCLIAFLPTVQSTDFYVCDCTSSASVNCIPGDDMSLGNQESPWQSYDKARNQFTQLGPGDSIQFCKGGAWLISGGSIWTNTACQAGNPCIVTDYMPLWATSNESRPILQRVDNNHGFWLTDGGNANHEEGYRFENLDLRGSNDGESRGFFLFNDIDDVVIDNVVIQNFDIGVHVANSNPCDVGDFNCDGQNERITLRNSTVINNESMGWLGASSGSQVLNNYFENNGSLPTLDHNIYISSSAMQETFGIKVIGNQLYKNSQGVNNSCDSTSLVVHGIHTDLLIEGNEIWEDLGAAEGNCWGIQIDNSNRTEAFHNVIVRGNTIRNIGNSGIAIGGCSGCIVENNVLIHQQNFGYRAINLPTNGPTDFLDNITVRNNSIYIDTNNSSSGITINHLGNNHVIVSNAIHYVGTNNSFNCIDSNLLKGNFDEVDNNLCFHPGANFADWMNGIGGLGEWQSSSGFDMNSAVLNPNFINPEMGQLNPADESANSIDLGHLNRSSLTDINGILRNNPDIGAYEWVATNVIFVNGFE